MIIPIKSGVWGRNEGHLSQRNHENCYSLPDGQFFFIQVPLPGVFMPVAGFFWRDQVIGSRQEYSSNYP